MPRRARIVRRVIVPDPKFGSRSLAKFINRIMMRGKKSTAERIMYGALDIIENNAKRNPVEVFDLALRNATPTLEVKPRRVGGATYQVPVEIKGERRTALAMRWLIGSARARAGKSMSEKMAAELLDASKGLGATIKRREDTHRMADANKAFAHYRW
ncbi:MAG: 30S ribosomal protein S7 [Chloroflexi bacterium]|nr:30S ribosomal protein S7 [Chloroflexota bacterium]